MDLDSLRKRYARVIIGTGINLQEGQPLLIRTEHVQREFALMLAEAAYEKGARMVSIMYRDPVLDRLRIDRSVRDDFLEFVPSHIEDMYGSFLDDGWCTISLRGPEDPDVMEGADPDRMGISGKSSSRSMRQFLQGISANRIAWNVCLHPTEAWAGKVLGSGGNWRDRIWEVLVPILRLDSDDPVEAWLSHDRELKRRTSYLNEALYDGIHFLGPGTDLFVGMAPDRVFAGGRCINNAGIDFFPNIPTEEVFSTPVAGRTRGTVRTTRPVEVMGAQVNGAWFRFEDGYVADFGAETNAGVLAQYLEFDRGARALGEVALVDVNSPIFASGRIFYNILFDENAACHIALGNGYTDCIRGGTGMSREELDAIGCNTSLVHTDFMIGSEEISVYGVRQDGSEEAIMENGEFVI